MFPWHAFKIRSRRRNTHQLIEFLSLGAAEFVHDLDSIPFCFVGEIQPYKPLYMTIAFWHVLPEFRSAQSQLVSIAKKRHQDPLQSIQHLPAFKRLAPIEAY